MKHFQLLISICVILTIVSCLNEKIEHTSGITEHAKTIMGGCNQQSFADLKSAETNQDTVIFSIKNDTLSMFVGINYICCAPFVSDLTFSNDTIIAEITDACNPDGESCYCRCSCYYTWDFLFNQFENLKYNYRIILDDPRADGPAIFKEGTVTISEL